MDTWTHETDLVVVGSGAGGLTGALFAAEAGGEAIVLEKGPQIGGCSAMSGGALWVPCNDFLPALGVHDTPELALQYLTESTRGEVPAERLEAYVAASPELMRGLADIGIPFQALEGYPDYDHKAAGALPSGRTLGVCSFDGRALGPELARLRPPHPQTRIVGDGVMEWAHEAPRFVSAGLRARLFAARRWLRSAARRPRIRRWGRDPHLTMGQALIGRLLLALRDRQVPVWTDSGVTELVVEDGRVVGVVAGGARRIRARRGVLLASGGFSRNPELLAAHQVQPARPEWAVSHPQHTGDAIALGTSAGAALELMDSALWAPVSVVPGSDLPYIMALERCLPGSIVVDGTGERFCDESMPFPPFARLLLERGAVPATLVMSARFRRTYPAGAALPGLIRPDRFLPDALRSGYLDRYDTLAELATARGLDADALQRTATRFDGFARTGVDEDFGRGSGWLARFYGDPAWGPNPCMAPLGAGPFYALDLFPGSLGTLGGLRCDTDGAVLDEQGEPIAGLYATGNCASPIAGRAYPASGLTLGPAMAFAFLAAAHALAQPLARPVRAASA